MATSEAYRGVQRENIKHPGQSLLLSLEFLAFRFTERVLDSTKSNDVPDMTCLRPKMSEPNEGASSNDLCGSRRNSRDMSREFLRTKVLLWTPGATRMSASLQCLNPFVIRTVSDVMEVRTIAHSA